MKHFGVLMTKKAPFCASLRRIRTVFSRLLKKAILMALWMKASLCVKSSLLEQSLPRTQSRPKQNQCNLRNLRLINSCLYSLFLCVFCAFLWLKNPRNLRNLRLINDLRACKLLYNCREDSTTIESSLQINLFMQNKAKFRKVKLNVNKVLTKDYDKMDTWSIRKTKPIQSQLKPIKCQNKPNSCPPSVWRVKPKKTLQNAKTFSYYKPNLVNKIR